MLPETGEIVKKRRALGLTQHQLARLAGVSQSLIAKLEARKIDPSYSKTKAIFNALDLLERKTETHAREILHETVLGVQKNALVSEAVRVMTDYGFSQLPVFDGNHPVGSISEKTVLSQVLAGKELEKISSLSVEEIMEEGFPQIGEDAPMALVSGLLQIYPAVLIVSKGKVLGIATKADLLKILHK